MVDANFAKRGVGRSVARSMELGPALAGPNFLAGAAVLAGPVLCALLIMLVSVGAVTAQTKTYKKIDKDVITDPREARSLKGQVGLIVKSPNPLTADEQKKLQDYYVRHIIAGMTRDEPLNNPALFPEWRRNVVADMSAAGSAAKQAFVRDLIYSYAKRLADDKEYSPACRYNAVLLLGELNEREMQGSGRTVTPAIPFAKARAALLERFNDPEESAAIKVGALIGLARHNRLAAAAGSPDRDLIRLFVGVLEKKQADATVSLDGLHWMQRIAAEALGDAGQPGAAKLLEPLVADESLPVSVRCAAAGALGRLAYQPTDDLDEAALLKTLGKLATNALQSQMALLKEYIDTNQDANPYQEGSFRPAGEPARGEGGRRGEGARGEGGRGEEEMTPAIPENPVVSRVRRQLKFQLLFVRIGLRGIEPIVVDANAKKAHVAVLSEIEAILKQLDESSMLPKDLFDKLGQPFLRLETAVAAA